MNKILTAITLGALLAPGAAFAEPQVSEIVVLQSAKLPAATNVRVNITNPGSEADHPEMVNLYVRRNDSEMWRLAKSWNLHDKILPGQRLSHDYFPGADGEMDPAFYADSFELKAVIMEDGGDANSLMVTHG